MRITIKRFPAEKFGASAGPSPGRDGFVLVLVIVSIIILAVLGLGMLSVAYGVRHRAIKLKNETAAMMAAEAGYEEAIFWMSQQQDMLSAIQKGTSGTRGALGFPDSSCDYQIKLFAFVHSRPVYRVISNGHGGIFDRTVEVYVVQALSGWDMGMCRVPLGENKTYPVNFADGEIINMRIHINDFRDNPDERDIYIDGEPRFLELVTMGESRYTGNDYDKYNAVMDFFEEAIYFNQPDCRITDAATVQSKLDRFRDSTKPQFVFVPQASSDITNPHAAVQLEFFVEGGVGKVRVTNDCTVLGYQRDKDDNTLDFKIKPGTDGEESERYDVYAYHFMPENAEAGGSRSTRDINDFYISQVFGDVESELGGQIFVEGNVIIGGDLSVYNGDQVVKGRMTVVATGNIWIVDSILLDGGHDLEGLPSQDNPNVLGLIAQGVVKVVDPGVSGYDTGYKNYYPGPPEAPDGYKYVPIGRQDAGGWILKRVGGGWVKVWQEAEEYDRHLPDPMVVEAAITVGGGGWGAENVEWNGYGNRKEASSPQDDLVVHGTITEAIRGVVGLVGRDGYLKHYYLDKRILEGILPGDIWLRSKYVPAPAGWHDYRH